MRSQATLLQSGHRRLCALYAREARDIYPGRSWHEIEPHVRRAWEVTPQRVRWREAAPVVRAFWLQS